MDIADTSHAEIASVADMASIPQVYQPALRAAVSRLLAASSAAAAAQDTDSWRICAEIEDQEMLALAAEPVGPGSAAAKLAAAISALLRAWKVDGAPINAGEILALLNAALADMTLCGEGAH